MTLTEELVHNPAICSVGIQAMVVSSDLDASHLLGGVLEEMGIRVQHFGDESEAAAQMDQDRFEAVVLDFDTIARTLLVLESLSASRSSHGALVFGVATEIPALQRALEQGVSVSFQRPLQTERIHSVLRAAYRLMLHDRRRYFRYGVSVPVRLKRRTGEQVHCTSINISQNGAALSLPRTLDLGEEIELIFVIPEVDGLIVARGVVIWHDQHGKAGVRFECCSRENDSRLADWMDAQFVQSVSKTPQQE
jgi:DNA-binding response OmpR family regulator